MIDTDRNLVNWSGELPLSTFLPLGRYRLSAVFRRLITGDGVGMVIGIW